MNPTFYDLSAQSLQGKTVSMGDFRGKTLLLVNTASKCGFTPQFEGLEAMYRKYKDQGLMILGFPCNQFGAQEPGDEKSIAEGCLLNYGVSFPMFSKIEVNGENAHPIFQYLKKALPGLGKADIKWNFTKFLIDKDGQPRKRFAPATKPEKVEVYLLKHHYVGKTGEEAR
ncbi:MAG: glutathione peroxidase [Candidatus Neomarinimicrobiota bacterium]|jgi:glutathione peroxidase|nr:glutathione peroxidase [Candidatus Neomarinimicrobiota bacterium]MDD3965590.1 glutathione peroxidase [Candidatus Neomarinimicrobiota bacterium]MDX9779428.1 glutathione peroxidase [bacterium]